MTKIEITKEQAISDLKNIFGIVDFDPSKGSEEKGKFLINKKYLERFEVIELLQNYFEDKMFEKGLGLVVGNITFIYTDFEIKKI